MTTRKKLEKRMRRGARKARMKGGHRQRAAMARGSAREFSRSLPTDAFACMNDCLDEMWRIANDPVLSCHPSREMARRVFERAAHLTMADMADLGIQDISDLNEGLADSVMVIYEHGARNGIEASIWPDNETLLELDVPTFPDTVPAPMAKALTGVYWRGYHFFHRAWADVPEEDEPDDYDKSDYEDEYPWCHDAD